MFKELFPHLSKLKVNLTIQEATTPGQIIVSAIPTFKKGEEAVNKAMPPFTVTGTPEELDEKFVQSFTEAANFLSQKSTDMEKWKKDAEAATAKSEGAKKLKEAEEKKIKDAKEKAKKTIEKADSLFKEKKYDAARLYYREALSAIGGKDSALEKKIAECDKFSESIGLFGETTPASSEITTDADNNDSESTEEFDEEPNDNFEDEDSDPLD